jgi:predicted GNAT family acetyltransferase
MTTEVNPDLSTRARVRHEPALARYTLWVDDRNVGLADYVATGRAIHFMNTEIDPARRGEGLDALLIEHALNDVRTRTSLPVIADCPLVSDWIDENVEYQDLLTRGR